MRQRLHVDEDVQVSIVRMCSRVVGLVQRFLSEVFQHVISIVVTYIQRVSHVEPSHEGQLRIQSCKSRSCIRQPTPTCIIRQRFSCLNLTLMHSFACSLCHSHPPRGPARTHAASCRIRRAHACVALAEDFSRLRNQHCFTPSMCSSQRSEHEKRSNVLSWVCHTHLRSALLRRLPVLMDVTCRTWPSVCLH